MLHDFLAANQAQILRSYCPMGAITMWSCGDRKCVLAVEGGELWLRLLDETLIVRAQAVESGGPVLQLAELWESEQRSATLHTPAGEHVRAFFTL